jgi:hypothetical protein
VRARVGVATTSALLESGQVELLRPVGRHTRLVTSCAVSDMMTGQDYTGAVSTERGRCFRLVYDEFGKPSHCSQPVTRNGWLYLAYPRKWYPVDSCQRHVNQLAARPQRLTPGASWEHERIGD